jgi:hypothetical protein
MALDWITYIVAGAKDLIVHFWPMEMCVLQGKWVSFLKLGEEWRCKALRVLDVSLSYNCCVLLRCFLCLNVRL